MPAKLRAVREYLRVNESFSKTILVCLSGAQVGLIHGGKMPKISLHCHFKSGLGIHSFALRSSALFALLKRETRVNRSHRFRCSCWSSKAVKSDESNSFFIKEQFALFKSKLWSFLKRILHICSFCPAFPLFISKTKERIVLFALSQKSYKSNLLF